MSQEALERAILESIWARVQWDFLLQNAQLSDWLEGSYLLATDEPDLYQLVVANPSYADWLGTHTFAIRRSLSAELKRPVVVRVVAREAVK